jgi:hypothetical protein
MTAVLTSVENVRAPVFDFRGGSSFTFSTGEVIDQLTYILLRLAIDGSRLVACKAVPAYSDCMGTSSARGLTRKAPAVYPNTASMIEEAVSR